MTPTAAERYVTLGLELGRHVDGIVDAYFGPRELAEAIEAAPPVEPRTLVAAAEALLDELEDGWLRDQVAGLRIYAGALAGESRSYADEVEGCYGVRPAYTDEAVFTAAHERLEELLPGDGSLAERYKRWEDSIRVPTERVEGTVAAVIEKARTLTRDLIELPDGDFVIINGSAHLLNELACSWHSRRYDQRSYVFGNEVWVEGAARQRLGRGASHHSWPMPAGWNSPCTTRPFAASRCRAPSVTATPRPKRAAAVVEVNGPWVRA